jgi:Galactose oxidase, central domain
LREPGRRIVVTMEDTAITPPRRRTRSRALIGIGLVALLGAGLGAYFGIRGVAGAGSAPTAGQPAARTGAAMAYDAADRTVVMFGGEGRKASLGDTWIWDGAAWTQAHPSTSPPALAGAQMTYDPVSHDLLLVGGQRLTGVTPGGAVCESTGSSGSSSSGSVKWIPPSGVQPADAPAAGSNLNIPPLISTGCGFSVANSVTWVWNGSDWTKAGGTTPAIGYGEWNLATDPVSARALLLADQALVAQPDAPIAEPSIACPMQTTVTNGATTTSPCPVFPIQTTNHSYLWTGHAWQVIKGTPHLPAVNVFGSQVISDTVTGQLAIFGNEIVPATVTTCPTCGTGTPIPIDAPVCCSGGISVWSGTTWKQTKSYTNGPMLSNGIFVGDPSSHSDLALTGNGETWTWTGVWTRQHPRTTPTALDGTAFAYDASTGQVVIFGGSGFSGHAGGLYNQTWTWDGSDWSLRGGSTSPAVTIPVPSPVSVPPALPCNSPVHTAPSDVQQPQYACSGSTPGRTGGGSGSASGGSGGTATGASGSASSTGILTP